MNKHKELPKYTMIAMYRLMQLSRRFDERLEELTLAGKIFGGTHPDIGQEAVAVGVCTALRKDDCIFPSHRCHTAVLAKGGDVRLMLAEIGGKNNGYCHGKGGSLHLTAMDIGVYPASGIVAANIAQATGAALAQKILRTDKVCVAFFGDGASNQGLFHESLNMAAIWKVPIVFVCENNGYAITTPVGYAVAVENIGERARAYNMSGSIVDGMDVLVVYEAAREAVERARSGGGATLIECKTYRYCGHSSGEKAMGFNYRDEAEIEKWKQNDPIVTFASRLVNTGLATEAELLDINKEVDNEIRAAEEFTEKGAVPATDELWEDVYAEPLPGLPVKGYLGL